MSLMASDGTNRRRIERELLEAVQLASAQYEDLSRKHSQALDDAWAAEGRDGNLLLARCLQMQPAAQEALEQYVVALSRFSELVLNRRSPLSVPEEKRSLLSSYRDAVAVLANASKLAADASSNGTPGAVDRLWAQCERAWLSCVSLRDEIAAKAKQQGRGAS